MHPLWYLFLGACIVWLLIAHAALVFPSGRSRRVMTPDEMIKVFLSLAVVMALLMSFTEPLMKIIVLWGSGTLGPFLRFLIAKRRELAEN